MPKTKKRRSAKKSGKPVSRAQSSPSFSLFMEKALDSSVGMALLDENKRFLHVNSYFSNLLGYTKEELCQMSLSDVTHPDDIAADEKEISRVYSKDKVLGRREKRYIRKDGSFRWAEVTFSAVQTPEKKVAYFAQIHDVTEIKFNEDRLERLSRMLVSFGTDSKENINRITQLAGELLQADVSVYSRLKGKLLETVGSWNTPADFPEAYEAAGHICHTVVREGGEEPLVLNDLPNTKFAKTDENINLFKLKSYIGKSVHCRGGQVGSLCAVFTRKVDFTVNDERLMRILASAVSVEEERLLVQQGITDREEKHLETNRFLDSVVENIPDMIFVKDAKDLRFVRFNRAGEELLGVGRDDMIGKNDYDFFPPDQADFFTQKDRDVLNNKRLVEIREESIDTQAKGRRVLHTKKIPILDKAGDPVYLLGISEDITERIQAEEALRLKENELAQSQKMESIGRLAGGIAHEFNNILTGIIGLAQMTKDEPEKTEQVRKDSDMILVSSRRAAHLVNELLTFGRKREPKKIKMSINRRIEGMRSILKAALGEAVKLDLELSSQMPYISADPNQVEQVLLNLALNARDATEAGGRIVIETSGVELDAPRYAQLGAVPPGSYALLRVSDNGSGMSKEVLGRLFEPFYTTKPVGQGTGLGLSVVYGIVQGHNGIITVESNPGKGSSFSVYFPADNGGESEGEDAGEVSSQGGETILVAEDQGGPREVLVRILERAGYRVLVATDGEEALSVFNEHSADIDLLVLDVVMPKLSGIEAFERIKESRKDIAALFITGCAADDERVRAAHKEHSISKPFSSEQLCLRIRGLLDKTL